MDSQEPTKKQNEPTRKSGSEEPNEPTRKAGVGNDNEPTRKASSDSSNESTRKAGSGSSNESTHKASSNIETGEDYLTTKKAKSIQESLLHAGDRSKIFDSFELKGITYNRVETISTNTGEGQIYLVETTIQGRNHQFVLKLYNRIVDDEMRTEFEQTITEILSRVTTIDNYNIVKVFDYGKCSVCDGKPILEREYELMEYLRGGTLNDVFPVKKLLTEEQILKFAYEAASALNACHKKRFIHMDMKPKNLFFRDEKRTDLVLGDFGISVLFADGRDYAIITKQERTPSYAPPEFYIAIDGIINVTPKADFYSLGITLMEAWNGINPFVDMKGNERKILEKKQDELSYDKSIPERLLTLVRGLTRRKESNRWGFEQIERWYKGETVEVIAETSTERDEADKKFPFDIAQGLYASTPEQMAMLLFENEEKGTRFLYKGEISNWLRKKIKDINLAIIIDEICEEKYPNKDKQNVGLLVAAWTLDKNLPFKAADGQVYTSFEELAKLYYRNIDQYKEALSKPDDRFYAYLDIHGQKDLAKKLLDCYAKTKDKLLAIHNVIYTLSPAFPWFLKLTKNGIKACKNETEIVDSFISEYSDWTDDTRNSFLDGRFLAWLNHRANVTKEFTLYNAVNNWLKDPTSGLYSRLFGIMLNLRPDLSYMLELPGDSTYCYKATDIGAKINEYIDIVFRQGKRNESEENELYQLAQLNGWMYVYLKNRNMGALLANKNAYFDLKKNGEKTSFYGEVVGEYKFISACGCKPWYYFPKADKKVTTLDELKSIPREEVREQLKNGVLREWLTLHFQENPHKKYTVEEFERATVDYTNFVGSYDPDNIAYARFVYAQNQVKDKIGGTTRNYKLFTTLRILFVTLMTLPTLVLIFLLFKDGIPVSENPLPGKFWDVSFWYYLIVGGIIFLYYLFSGGLVVGLSCAAVFSIVIYYIVYIIAAILTPVFTYVIIGILALMFGLCLYKAWGAVSSIKQIKHTLNPNNFQLSCVEPLYFAYQSNDEYFYGSTFETLDNFNNSRKYYMKRLLKWSIPGIILFAGLLVAFFMLHPNYNAAFKEKIELQNRVKFMQSLGGTWYGKVDKVETSLVLVIGEFDVSGTFKVNTKKPYSGTFSGIMNADDRKFIQTEGELNYRYKGTITGEFTEDWSKLTVVYSAATGTRKMEIEYTRDQGTSTSTGSANSTPAQNKLANVQPANNNTSQTQPTIVAGKQEEQAAEKQG
ncbi:MAG: protein kinase [Prevotellaceae bacterium]|jgi:serine/threonine protein kinase|nr:protein kinase [Prevotellaceae bacterium]